jgi:hypothetical protein
MIFKEFGNGTEDGIYFSSDFVKKQTKGSFY